MNPKTACTLLPVKIEFETDQDSVNKIYFVDFLTGKVFSIYGEEQEEKLSKFIFSSLSDQRQSAVPDLPSFQLNRATGTLTELENKQHGNR